MACENIPIKLKLASVDKQLYNKTLYWSVHCLENTTLIDPTSNASTFKLIATNPSELWNFCNSTGCTATTKIIQLTFTLNPNSENHDDYLFFIVNLDTKQVTGPVGNINIHLVLDNVQVTKNFTEIWIKSSTSASSATPSSMMFYVSVASIILLFLIIFIAIIFLIYYYYKNKQNIVK